MIDYSAISDDDDDDYEEKECLNCGCMTHAYEAFIVGLDEFYCPDCCPDGYGE